MTAPPLRWFAMSRMVYGVGALAAPRTTGRLFGLTVHTDAGDTHVWRVSFANREVALGALEWFAQSAPPPVRRRLNQGIAAIDAADAIAATLLGRRDPQLRSLIVLAVPFSMSSVYLHLQPVR